MVNERMDVMWARFQRPDVRVVTYYPALRRRVAELADGSAEVWEPRRGVWTLVGRRRAQEVA